MLLKHSATALAGSLSVLMLEVEETVIPMSSLVRTWMLQLSAYCCSNVKSLPQTLPWENVFM